MLVPITLLVLTLAAGFVFVLYDSARSRKEERVYRRDAMSEGQVAYDGEIGGEILSTDDQYLHPQRTRSKSSRLRR